MELDFESTSFILNILLLCLGLYLAFFKSYFSEKGKQLAIKEDVEEITTKVENIKSEFIRETEKIKSELSLLTQHEFSLSTEERNAILGFYESYATWLNLIMEIRPSDIKKENTELYAQLISVIDEAKLNIDNAESRADLFIEEEEFTLIKKDLKIETLKLQHNVDRYMSKYVFLLEDHNRSLEGIPNEQRLEINRQHYAIQKDHLDEFNKKHLEQYQVVIGHERKMRSYLRNRLFRILQPKTSENETGGN